ncbi:LysR family transcriptional regulator [Piscinibacter sp. HJYY11]|uniref:LysR family transcriptional regulator n=1 Tax=Piscinibacter sp. HJYY11 TaxID=2801333 RepID=UPI00191F26C3|nr:LysR family transcriptional regulator [Piscinibacter sp. HJYY11]MBL0728387.1 LysR family transcriptional regulator [Piscinibacter sp. HJYY11]
MDKLEGMRIFVTVADAKGFAPAARQLGLSAPAVTRAVAALEARIGTQLLRRSTRQVVLTEAGVRFHADCKRILAEVDVAEASASGAHAVPQGLLSVTAPVIFGRLHVAPVLQDFLGLHPQVSARSFYTDQIVHLLDEGMDVALRIAHLPDSGLVAVRVGEVRRVVVASPQYLAEHGVPRTPQEVSQHRGIGFSQHGSVSSPWVFYPPGRSARGDGEIAHPQLRHVTNAGDAAIGGAVAHQGLARALSYQVAEHVLAGRLQIVMADHEPPPIPVQLVHVDGRRAAAKVRAFVDHAAERLRAEPVLNGTLRWPDPA